MIDSNLNTTVSTFYAEGGYIYEGESLKMFPHPEGYIEPVYDTEKSVKKFSKTTQTAFLSGYQYAFNYTDHLENVRLTYADSDGDGAINRKTEIISEKHYYPFGLKHRGYNDGITSNKNDVAEKFKYNGIEQEKALGLNLYEMPLRQYDPAIARWTGIDPVIHHSMSTYTAFDNNPVFWADPSGADSATSIQDAWNQTDQNGSSTWFSDGNGGFCNDCPKEGQSRDAKKSVGYGRGATLVDTKQYYHSGGLNGSEEGWYFENEYLNIIDPVAGDLSGNRDNLINLGYAANKGSIEWFNNVESTDDLKLYLASRASYLSNLVYRSGYIEPMGIDSPFFGLGAGGGIYKAVVGRAKTSQFAFWSGKGTRAAAEAAGFKTIGQTRAGINLNNLTANMAYYPRSQAWVFWERLSAALARSVPKGGRANVFLTRESIDNAQSIWNTVEKQILLDRNVRIITNIID